MTLPEFDEDVLPEGAELDLGMRRSVRQTAIAVERDRDDRLADETVAAIARSVAESSIRARRRARVRSIAFGAVAFAAAALIVASRRETPPAVAAPVCSVSGVLTGTRTLAAGERFDDDPRARFELAEGSVATWSSTDPCSTRVTLERGSIGVWARRLGGGELVVVAAGVEVTVHGTVFEVGRDGARVSVAVEEGRVGVRASGPETVLVGGEAIELTSGTGVRRPVEEEERIRLERLRRDRTEAGTGVVPTVVVGATEPSVARDAGTEHSGEGPETGSAPRATTTERLAAAEAAYREGRLDEARTGFRAVGSLRGADAEAAWLRLGRLEQRAGHVAEAAAALEQHRRRFPNGRLAAEALYLEARARRSLGQASIALELEDRLLADYPTSPQATRVRALRSASPD